jgi:hypothetical protein
MTAWRRTTLLVLALFVVILFFGLGFFALHLLLVVAAVLFVLWLIGFAIGRGEGAGRNHFYRW